MVYVLMNYEVPFFKKTFSYQEEIELGNELPDGFYLVELNGSNHHLVIPILKSR